MDYTNYIESDSSVMLGKPVLKGTRIAVSLILRKLSEGATAEDILAAYTNLTTQSIDAVLAFAADAV